MSIKKKAEMKAVIKSKFLCQDKFSNDIETLVKENAGMNYIEAVCHYCEQNGIEIESVYDIPSWKLLHRKYFTQEDVGIGKLYQQTCVNYGFDPEDAGKVMGMAAYGKHDAYYIQQKW